MNNNKIDTVPQSTSNENYIYPEVQKKIDEMINPTINADKELGKVFSYTSVGNDYINSTMKDIPNPVIACCVFFVFIIATLLVISVAEEKIVNLWTKN